MKKIKSKNKLHYTGCGLDYVYLVDGFDLYEDDDGDISYAIRDADKLHKAIAYGVVTEIPHLRGMELRFLRSFLQVSQESLAKCLRRTRDAIAKLEAAPKKDLPDQTEALLRFYVMGEIQGNTSIKKVIRILRDIEESQDGELVLQNKEHDWNVIAA